MENSEEPSKAIPDDEPGEECTDVQMEVEETEPVVSNSNVEQDSNNKRDESISTNEPCSSTTKLTDGVVSQNPDGDSEKEKSAESPTLESSTENSSAPQSDETTNKSPEQETGGNDENVEKQSSEKETAEKDQAPVPVEETTIDKIGTSGDEDENSKIKDAEMTEVTKVVELEKSKDGDVNDKTKDVEMTEERTFEANISIEEKKSDDSDSAEENVVETSVTKRRKPKNRRVIVDWVCVNPDCTRDGKSNPELVSTARPFVLGHFGKNDLLISVFCSF